MELIQSINLVRESILDQLSSNEDILRYCNISRENRLFCQQANEYWRNRAISEYAVEPLQTVEQYNERYSNNQPAHKYTSMLDMYLDQSNTYDTFVNQNDWFAQVRDNNVYVFNANSKLEAHKINLSEDPITSIIQGDSHQIRGLAVQPILDRGVDVIYSLGLYIIMSDNTVLYTIVSLQREEQLPVTMRQVLVSNQLATEVDLHTDVSTSEITALDETSRLYYEDNGIIKLDHLNAVIPETEQGRLVRITEREDIVVYLYKMRKNTNSLRLVMFDTSHPTNTRIVDGIVDAKFSPRFLIVLRSDNILSVWNVHSLQSGYVMYEQEDINVRNSIRVRSFGVFDNVIWAVNVTGEIHRFEPEPNVIIISGITFLHKIGRAHV